MFLRKTVFILLLLFLNFSTVLGQQHQSKAHEATLTLELKLLEKSPRPKQDDIFVYQEGLVVYRYKVLKVVQGTYEPKEILVSHWAVKQNVDQKILKVEIGSTSLLSLRPFDDFPGDIVKCCGPLKRKPMTYPSFFTQLLLQSHL